MNSSSKSPQTGTPPGSSPTEYNGFETCAIWNFGPIGDGNNYYYAETTEVVDGHCTFNIEPAELTGQFEEEQDCKPNNPHCINTWSEPKDRRQKFPGFPDRVPHGHDPTDDMPRKDEVKEWGLVNFAKHTFDGENRPRWFACFVVVLKKNNKALFLAKETSRPGPGRKEHGIDDLEAIGVETPSMSYRGKINGLTYVILLSKKLPDPG